MLVVVMAKKVTVCVSVACQEDYVFLLLIGRVNVLIVLSVQVYRCVHFWWQGW